MGHDYTPTSPEIQQLRKSLTEAEEAHQALIIDKQAIDLEARDPLIQSSLTSIEYRQWRYNWQARRSANEVALMKARYAVKHWRQRVNDAESEAYWAVVKESNRQEVERLTKKVAELLQSRAEIEKQFYDLRALYNTLTTKYNNLRQRPPVGEAMEAYEPYEPYETSLPSHQ